VRKIIIICFLCVYCCITQAQSIEALLIIEKNSNVTKIELLRQMGRKFILKAKPDSADYCFRKALEIAKKEQNINASIIQLYTDLSRTYTLRRKPEFALEELKEAKKFITPSIKNSILERYYFFSGYVYRLLNITDSAIYFYKKAELINEIENPYTNWEVYRDIGQLFYYNEDFKKAEEYLLKSYKISRKENKKMDHGIVLYNLSMIYSKQERPVEFAAVQKEYNELIELDKKDFSKDAIHSMLFSSWGNKSLDEQIKFLTQVKNVHIKNKFNQGASLANSHIADIYEKANQPNKALECLLENRDNLIDKNNFHIYYSNLTDIYNLQKKTGQFAEAIQTANDLLALNKKISNITNRELTLTLEKKYETEKKEKEIELLNSKNKLTDIELLRQTELRESLERENTLQNTRITQQIELSALSKSEKDLQFKELEKERLLNSALARENNLSQQLISDDKKRKRILWIGVILCALAGGVILYQYRRQLIKNAIIDKQKEDLVMLNREIHHRVKNNLQVISSMLDLQSAATDNEMVAEKFQTGSQRVQSMAFVHQNLYQGEDHGTIDIQQYIKMLTNNLMQSYNTLENKVTLHTDVEAMRLHSDTVIPIGLIINELVSNSLKYAFRNKPDGEIHVVLKKNNEDILLQVKDNGIGIPDSKNVTSGPSFGYKIIQAFAKKLKALVTINSSKGTDVQIMISKYKTT